MTFKLGLTGSIGMGKSTTAKLFADEGCAVWDADAAVHRMYSKDGAAVQAIQKTFPKAVVDGEVSRDVLKDYISEDANVLKTIEKIVHPLVANDRALFIRNSKSDITVLDIPLLFELGTESSMDAVVCVSVSAETQKSRVLARGTMTEDQFNAIIAKQIPNDDKCGRSDYVVLTETLETAKLQVKAIVQEIRGHLKHA